MPVEIIKGNGPVILALPYTGTDMQRLVANRLANENDLVTAPDRYLDRLLSDSHPDLHLIRARFHRFLSDVEKPQPDQSKGFSKGMIGVVPLNNHEGNSIWHEPPALAEAARWHSTFYVPYHAALRAQVARIRSQYGFAILVTCRAHRRQAAADSGLPPADIWLSNNRGASCDIEMSARLLSYLQGHPSLTTALNREITAGWATRSYARPSAGIHALQLDIGEDGYLGAGEMEGTYDRQKSEPLRGLLSEAFDFLNTWTRD